MFSIKYDNLRYVSHASRAFSMLISERKTDCNFIFQVRTNTNTNTNTKTNRKKQNTKDDDDEYKYICFGGFRKEKKTINHRLEHETS